MLYRLSQDIPDKRFSRLPIMSVCPHMKLTTLDKVLNALTNGGPVVTRGRVTRVKALRAVERMIGVGV